MMVLIAAGVIGLIAGSGITALVHRIMKGGNWLLGRSHCPRCTHVLNPNDLVPLLSFIALRGRCRYCRGPVSWLYPAVEVAVSALFVAAIIARVGGAPTEAVFENSAMRALILRDWAAICILVAIFCVDVSVGIIPDILTLPALILFFIWNLFLREQQVAGMLIGAAVGAGFFSLQYTLSRGRWIGGGDIRLGALMGTLLGWPAVVAALLIAYVSGAAVGVALVVGKQKSWQSHIPFGTFLSAGTLAALLWYPYLAGAFYRYFL